MSNRYVSLHQHTEYSALDGYAKTADVARRANKLGMPSIAITDHGEVSGHLQFQKDCAKYDVHPVFGMEGYLVDSVSRVKAEKDKKNNHFCVFAETQQGLENLWKLSTVAYQNKYYKPLADLESLGHLKDGLIVTDGCLLSNVARFLANDQYDEAKAWSAQILQMFGNEHYYSELHTFQLVAPQTEREIKLNADMVKMNIGKMQIAKELGIQVVCVNDSHYAEEKDWENHQLLWQLSTNQEKVSDQVDAGKAASWIMSDEEMYYWMSRNGVPRSITEQAIENTALIAERCDASIGKTLRIPLLTGDKTKDLNLFESHIESGFQKKVVDKGLDIEKYADRVGEELDLIVSKDFFGYFNIVSDYAKYAKSQGWLVGPARGSAGGSLVAYLLDITEIDPLKYGLLLSRFISPGRKDYPDIDLDFPQSKRGQVKEYLADRFGQENVASIGTLTRSGPKGLLRDLCRAMKIDFGDMERMSKIINQVKNFEADDNDDEVPWDEVIAEKGGELAEWNQKYPKLFNKLQEMLGLIRQTSTHAAGVVISDLPLMGIMPMRTDKNGDLVTQFEAPEVEELGFIKFDILGIRHLDTIVEALRLIHGEVDINNLYNMSDTEYSDQSVWDEITAGNTMGISQLETVGMTAVGKRLKPHDERDIATLISINRPGVIDAGMLDEYLWRRAGIKPVSYTHRLMSTILEPTYGVIVYQEQAMKLSQILAGYTAEQAEVLRKAMGKKLESVMSAERPKFIQGCLDNPAFTEGLNNPKAIAENIWNQLSAAQRYSFNESHAQGYALVSSWGAYLKQKYPAEYITACMQTDPTNVNKYIREARRLKIPILPPDINESGPRFRLTQSGIRYGLETIDHVGSAATKEIMQMRPFTSLEDFLERTSKRACTSAVVANLICVGAMDSIGDRTEMLKHLYAVRKVKDKVVPDFSDQDVVLAQEMSLLGAFVTRDPADKYRKQIERQVKLTPDEVDALKPEEIVFVGGQITKLHELDTKRGDRMAFMDLSWDDQTYNVTIFPRAFSANQRFLEMNTFGLCRVQKLEKGVHMLDFSRLDNW